MDDKTIFSEPWFAKAVAWSIGQLTSFSAWLIAQAPAFAGAVVSLAFIGELTPKGRMMAVVVGALTAMFVGPALIDTLHLVWSAMPGTVGRAITFFLSLTAMGGLPRLLKVLYPFWGDPLGLLDRLRANSATKTGESDA